MVDRTVTTDDLARLKREREDADRLYNEMLTALDGAIQRLREIPAPPPPYDDLQVTPLNARWELLPHKPAEQRGWVAKLRAQIWSVVGPLFERQQEFNAAVVDHVNRNVAPHRELASVLAQVLALLREEQEEVVKFQSALIVFAQQITPYVDTKDREVAALMRRINEDVGAAQEQVTGRLEEGIVALSATTGAVHDEAQMRWEAALAREQRLDAEVKDIRGAVGMLQRSFQTLKREMERRPAADPHTSGSNVQPVALQASPKVESLDSSYKYVGFEDQFRGPQQEIRERQAVYLRYFEGARDVLDIGCGRGEFLDLLRERGVTARGVDLNDEMAALCRSRGLDATTGDALTYLLEQPDDSLGGLFAAQVVEHLEPDYLMRLLDAAHQKLRTGATIILETINPACWYAFFSSYIRDITHVQPLHPDTLSYLLVASGFQRVQVRYSVPFPDEQKLQTISASETPEVSPPELVTVVNENVKKLNSLLFTYLDYAAIGERL